MSDTAPFSGNDIDMGWARVEPTVALRFVDRDGKPVLQQMVLTTTRNNKTSEWVDVPMHTEPPHQKDNTNDQ